MEKILEYRIDHKRKLIIDTIRGEIQLNELINHEKAKLHDPEHNDTYSALIDIRDSKFLLDKDEKEVVYNFYKEYSAKINMNRKCAFLTSKPKEVVTSELFKLEVNQFTEMTFRIFTTEEAAYRWLSVQSD